MSRLSVTDSDTDYLHFNYNAKDDDKFRFESVISMPTRSLHAISRTQTATKNKKPKKTTTNKKSKKKITLATLIFVGLMIVLILIGNYAITTQIKSNEDTTTKLTTTTLHNNITMTVYDFTSTPNPFDCEMKWIGDGICDDETNLFKCAFDSGDCCLNEIVDTNCFKCICHIDGKKHQMTTTTQIPQLRYISLLQPNAGKKFQKLVDNF